jgi:predicted ATPase
MDTAISRKSRLRYLELERFKGFEGARAPLGDFTVVVGTNASGKSNLRDAFRFLHGISRGYTLAEIIGEKWIEGGVLQWRGIRGGVREVAYNGSSTFAVRVGLTLEDRGTMRDGHYRIEVAIDDSGRVSVAGERLIVIGRGSYIFDSHPENHAPDQPEDPHHFSVRVKKGAQRGFVGRSITLLADRPALVELIDTSEKNIPADVRALCREARDALASMRFLDLVPDAMRHPSLPGQTVLGDRGENLSSVLQEICTDARRKDALIRWVRELTPLDVSDFDFVPDQTGRVLVTLIESNGRRTSAYSASDGTLRFLALVAAFLGAEPARLYFFEELETGLHPTRLHLLVQLVERYARHTSQVVTTTHSPQLLTFLRGTSLDSASLESVLLSYRREGEHAQRLRRLLDIPDAREVLMKQDIARLYGAGWLEDAVAFAEEADGGLQKTGDAAT